MLVGRTGVPRRKKNKIGPAVEVFGVPEVSMRAPKVGKLGIQVDKMCQKDAKRRGEHFDSLLLHTSLLQNT